MTDLSIAYHYLPKASPRRRSEELELQRAAIREVLGAPPRVEIVRVGSGNREKWPKLRKAVELAEQTGARLVIARLGRLTRNPAFLQILSEARIDFVVADAPHATRAIIHNMVCEAREHAQARSLRTKAALAAAKARGVRLGGDRKNLHLVAHLGRERSIERRRAKAEEHFAKVTPYIEMARAAGRASYGDIAEYLNLQGLQTTRGGQWTRQAVHKLVRSGQQPHSRAD
jgi:DNA invertase Pin-like site-specific DNA recombinase